MPINMLRANKGTACVFDGQNLGNGAPRITCCRVTDAKERRRFEFDSTADRNAVVFDLVDDYSFGVLQSSMHAAWIAQLCSTRNRSRYELLAFRTFPWPQWPSVSQVVAVTLAGLRLRTTRQLLPELEWSAQGGLDQTVMDAYRFDESIDPARFLVDLNQELAEMEVRGEPICGPGLPAPFNTPEFLRRIDLDQIPDSNS
jgi:hypothetical protein